MHPYVHEKLHEAKMRELEKQQMIRLLGSPRRRTRAARPIVRFAGRTLRRFGEGLEAWASDVLWER
jgi:hypothetical protein